MTNTKRRLWMIFLMLYPVAALAQDSTLSKLFRRASGGTETITISKVPAESIPKPLAVNNDTVVTIKVVKTPTTTCAVATKREELEPEPNPFAQFLKIISGLGVFGIAGINGDNLCPTPSGLVVPNDSEARQVEKSIANIRQSLLRSNQDMEQFKTQYEETAMKINDLTACKNNLCADEPTFNGAKTRLQTDIQGRLKAPLPVLESTELQIASLKKVLSDRYKNAGGPNEEMWINSVNERLDCFGSNLESIRQLRDALASLKADFEKFHDLLEAHQTSLEFSKQLPADGNAKVTGTVTCTNFFTKQPVGDPVPFTITYQNLPRATVSAGILISSLNKRQVGTQPLRTGTAPDGTPTFRVVFAETDKAEVQVVPFSFFNYYLSGTRKLNLNLTGGVGLNPNNGSNQVEFFVGGALGFKNLYLQIGGHIGRWQELGGGFLIGETVPAMFPAVPIERRYSMKPAIGISYRLPLP